MTQNTVRTPIVDKNGKATHVHRRIEAAKSGVRMLPGVTAQADETVIRGSKRHIELLQELQENIHEELSVKEHERSLFESKSKHPSADADYKAAAAQAIADIDRERDEALKTLNLVRYELRCAGNYQFYTPPVEGKSSFGLNIEEDSGTKVFLLKEGMQYDSITLSGADMRDLAEFVHITYNTAATPERESAESLVARLEVMEGQLSELLKNNRENETAIAAAMSEGKSKRELPYGMLARNVSDRADLGSIRSEFAQARTALTALEKDLDYAALSTHRKSFSDYSGIGLKLNDDGSAELHALRGGYSFETLPMNAEEFEEFLVYVEVNYDRSR